MAIKASDLHKHKEHETEERRRHADEAARRRWEQEERKKQAAAAVGTLPDAPTYTPPPIVIKE